MDPLMLLGLLLLNEKNKEPKAAPAQGDETKLVVDGITQRLVGPKATDEERAAVAKEVQAFVRARPAIVRALLDIFRRDEGLKVAK